MKAKKTVAASAVLLAVVCGTGGFITIRNQQQDEADNKLIEKQLEEVKNISVKEGGNLPDLKEMFAKASMIDQESIEVDIKNVDVSVPGTYDVVCKFNDVKGKQREKAVTCEVKPDLTEHVTGLEDLTINWGENLPPDNSQYDEYVESIIRDDSMVDIKEPGTYQLTYSILGANGDVEDVSKLVTVLDNKPAPTPTPSPAPVSKKDKKNSGKNSNKGNASGHSAEGQAEEGQAAEGENASASNTSEDGVTGNIGAPTENDHTVATSDTSNVVFYFGTFIAALAATASTLYKKTWKKES